MSRTRRKRRGRQTQAYVASALNKFGVLCPVLRTGLILTVVCLKSEGTSASTEAPTKAEGIPANPADLGSKEELLASIAFQAQANGIEI